MKTQKPSRGRRGWSPICLRVTPEEKAYLEARAGECRHPSVSSYMRARLFGMVRADAPVTTHGSRLSAAERQRLLAQVLGALGASKVLRNLSDLADTARIGALPLTPDVTQEIRAACAAVIEVRDLLLRALGLKKSMESQHDC